MTFNQYKDAKSVFAAIETWFGGNEATKKTQKTLLKQMYENFSATSTESLDFIFNRLQKIVSQLAVLDTMSIDDLYNNFKIVDQEVKRTASSNSSSQNMAFVSSPSTNSTNDVYTAYGVSTASTQSSTASTKFPAATSWPPSATTTIAAEKLFRRAFLANPKSTPRLPIYKIHHPTRHHAPPPTPKSPPQPAPPSISSLSSPPPPLSSPSTTGHTTTFNTTTAATNTAPPPLLYNHHHRVRVVYLCTKRRVRLFVLTAPYDAFGYVVLDQGAFGVAAAARLRLGSATTKGASVLIENANRVRLVSSSATRVRLVLFSATRVLLVSVISRIRGFCYGLAAVGRYNTD
nr:hypothetical protein [Tanacetum cinerariifolium]